MSTIFFDDIQKNYIPEILKEIYIDRIYEPFLTGRKNLVIVDAGANIGLASMYFKNFAKIVYAIEPAQSHLRNLENVITQNNITNIKILPFALSNKMGKRKLYLSPNPTANSLMSTITGQPSEEVQTITLDCILKNENIDHIDLLKLDVEGAESEIITSPDFIKIAQKISTIVGEWHDWGFTSRNFFADTMRAVGYQFSWKEGEASIFTCVR